MNTQRVHAGYTKLQTQIDELSIVNEKFEQTIYNNNIMAVELLRNINEISSEKERLEKNITDINEIHIVLSVQSDLSRALKTLSNRMEELLIENDELEKTIESNNVKLNELKFCAKLMCINLAQNKFYITHNNENFYVENSFTKIKYLMSKENLIMNKTYEILNKLQTIEYVKVDDKTELVNIKLCDNYFLIHADKVDDKIYNAMRCVMPLESNDNELPKMNEYFIDKNNLINILKDMTSNIKK